MAETPDTIENALREYLAYEPGTGELRWIKKPSRSILIGCAVGCLNKEGYRTVCLRRRYFLAHRVAFFLAMGRWPRGEIDHINGNRADNRLCNLRETDRAMNGQNVRKPLSTNRHGAMGATPKGNQWQAQIKVSKRTIYLGLFASPEEASAAYLAAKRRLHLGCTI